MDVEHLLELRQKEADYWWHVNKRTLLFDLLAKYQDGRGRILEIGCGGGLTSTLLAARGNWVVAADISWQAVQFVADNRQVFPVAFNANMSWPFKSQSFDVILMLDVLEHIAEDVSCLREAYRVLTENGILILTVPAHQFLFSSWDEIVGHKRRYSRQQLRACIQEAGLFCRLFSYANMLSFFPAIFVRGIERFGPKKRIRAEFPHVPHYLNVLLKQYGRLEATLLLFFRAPIGLSLAAVLSKRM